MDTVTEVGALKLNDPADRRDSQPHIGVDVSPKRLIEVPHLIEHGTPDHNRRAIDRILPEHRHEGIWVPPSVCMAPTNQCSGGVDDIESRGAQPQIWICAKRVDLRLELACKEFVIGTEPAHETAVGRRDTPVESVGGAVVRLAYRRDATNVPPDDCGGVIGGAIVHDDQFDGLVPLRKHALDGRGQVTSLVVNRNDDRDQGVRCAAVRSVLQDGLCREVAPLGAFYPSAPVPFSETAAREPPDRSRMAPRPRLGDKMPSIVQRSLGLMVALLGAPLMALMAIAIKLESPGPVLFKARRVGSGGREFICYKLRTMRWDPQPAGPAVTLAIDDRVTRLGAWLRRHRLDELPQLWNVAQGSMLLVGPRPEDPRFVDPEDPLHRVIFTATPGITGLTQLAFADEGAMIDSGDPERHYREVILPRKLAIDADYLRRRSARLDLWILGQTILTAFGRQTSIEAIEARR